MCLILEWCQLWGSLCILHRMPMFEQIQLYHNRPLLTLMLLFSQTVIHHHFIIIIMYVLLLLLYLELSYICLSIHYYVGVGVVFVVAFVMWSDMDNFLIAFILAMYILYTSSLVFTMILDLVLVLVFALHFAKTVIIPTVIVYGYLVNLAL